LRFKVWSATNDFDSEGHDEFTDACEEYLIDCVPGQDDFLEWLSNNPAIVMAAGLQEFVAAHGLKGLRT